MTKLKRYNVMLGPGEIRRIREMQRLDKEASRSELIRRCIWASAPVFGPSMKKKGAKR